MTPHPKPRKAIIVAAGRGRRLGPNTELIPKCLVPVRGESMLAIQLRALASHGIEEVVVIRGYKKHEFDKVRSSLPLPLRFVDNDEWPHNNILESLFCARAELSEPVLVSYSDIIYTPSVVGALLDRDDDISLVIDRDFRQLYEGRTEHPLSEAEVARVDESGRVRQVGKRSVPAAEAWGEFIGLARLSQKGAALLGQTWDDLAERIGPDDSFVRADRFRNAFFTDLLQYLIDDGHEVAAAEIRGGWREIDTVQDLRRAEETWLG